jgi:hypothetical protein
MNKNSLEADNDWLNELEADAREIPEDEKLEALRALADEYVTQEEEIREATHMLSVMEDRFRMLREDLIPDKMMELGIKKLVLDDGSTLAYAPFYGAKILDDAAYQYLEDRGYPDAVKQSLTLETSRLEKAVLERVMAFIMENDFVNLSLKEKLSVHHMTLGKLIKELTKQGLELPKHLFDVYIGNRATLKKGKADD